MTTTTTDTTKQEALAKFLGCEVSDIEQCSYDAMRFEAEGKEYLICTEEEAYSLAEDYINETLWAFRADYLIHYMHGLDSLNTKDHNEFVKVLQGMQETMCESCNPMIRLMVREKLPKLVQDAIRDDGIGHFLATYDNEEIEECDYFIYRTN